MQVILLFSNSDCRWASVQGVYIMDPPEPHLPWKANELRWFATALAKIRGAQCFQIFSGAVFVKSHVMDAVLQDDKSDTLRLLWVHLS